MKFGLKKLKELIDSFLSAFFLFFCEFKRSGTESKTSHRKEHYGILCEKTDFGTLFALYVDKAKGYFRGKGL